MLAYIATDLFVRGLQEAGPSPTRESFITNLGRVPNYDAGGLIEPVDLARSAQTSTSRSKATRSRP